MAVALVAINNITRVNAAEALGTVWQDLGGGATTVEADFVYQGSNSISEKVKTTEAGVKFFDTGTTHALSTSNRTVIFKHVATTSSVLNAEGVNGGILECGSGDRANYYRYYIVGGDTYPRAGGWLLSAVNPNLVQARDAVVGTPNLAAVNNYAWACDFTVSPKSENVAMDAIDFIDAGGGLLLTAGDGASPEGVFADFVIFDEGTDANAYGVVTTRAGILFVLGTLTIGSAAITEFTDANQTVVWPDARVDNDFHGLVLENDHDSTVINIANCSFIGRASQRLFRTFDSELDVNGGTEVITIVGHGFNTGDLVEYRDLGNTAVTGLVDLQDYFVNALTADTLALYVIGATVGRQNAITDTTRVGLTADSAGTGVRHALVRQNSARPSIAMVGDATGTALMSACTLLNCDTITGAQNGKFLNCNIIGARLLVDSFDGSIDGCTIDKPQNETGFFTEENTDYSNKFPNCTFIRNPDQNDFDNHVFKTTAAHTITSFTSQTYTDYGPTEQSFDTTADVVGGATDEVTIANHGYVAGDFVYYEKHGGTAVIGLTDSAGYYVDAPTVNTLRFYETRAASLAASNRIDLTSTGGETHSINSSQAVFFNDSGGLVTINVAEGDTPTIRNSSGSTTTVNNNVSVTFTGMKDNTEVRIYDSATGVEIDGIENATAGTVDDRSFAWADAAGNDVDYVLHNWLAGVTVYEHIRVNDFTVPSVATSIGIQQRIDRNAI